MKKQYQHYQNKKRIMPSDFDKISETQSTLSKLGYTGFRGQVLYSNKFVARERHPDLIVNLNGEIIPLELDGPVHGGFDEVSESEGTKWRNEDYFRAGFFPIIIHEEWLKVNNIDQETYLKCVLVNFEQIFRAKRRVMI